MLSKEEKPRDSCAPFFIIHQTQIRPDSEIDSSIEFSIKRILSSDVEIRINNNNAEDMSCNNVLALVFIQR